MNSVCTKHNQKSKMVWGQCFNDIMLYIRQLGQTKYCSDFCLITKSLHSEQG